MPPPVNVNVIGGSKCNVFNCRKKQNRVNVNSSNLSQANSNVKLLPVNSRCHHTEN